MLCVFDITEICTYRCSLRVVSGSGTIGTCVRTKELVKCETERILIFRFEVQLGEHDTSTEIDCDEYDSMRCAPPPQIIRAGRVMVHPGYQNKSLNRHNDIAIIPLKKPAEYNS